MTYRERLEARAARRREWAGSREAKSDAALNGARSIADGIPMGQPILVGHHSEGRHRRDVARIESGMAAGFEHARKAEEHESKADGIDAQLATSIYSDDVDAVEKIEAKIAAIEAHRDRLKRFNATCRKGSPNEAILNEKERAELASLRRIGSAFLGTGGGFPPYALTNSGANVRRLRERLETIKRDNATREAGSRGRGRSMFARFASTCPDCGASIERDTRIVYYRLTKEAVCADCVA